MGFWDFLSGGVNHAGETPNANPPSTVSPSSDTGDPNGVEITGDVVQARSLPSFFPTPWAGWPSSWSTPNWDFGSKFNELVDVAWMCLDKNASILSSMPVMRLRDGQVMEPKTWMGNPDPAIYASWQEFAKQLFWDYQLGEVFILRLANYADDNYPSRFRIIPPWVFHVEMKNGVRRYRLGGMTGPDVTDDILHIRYKSTTDSARGVGPLESAGGRMLTAGLLAKYVREVVSSGGVALRSIDVEKSLSRAEAKDLQDQYLDSVRGSPAPPVMDGGAKLTDHTGVNPKDLTMLEISQFNESRIAYLLGVPAFLVGLPSGGDSMTYSNVSSLFDFHDRQMLRPMDIHVMRALSFWALPRGQSVELNHDDYTRPSFEQRADAWPKLITAGVVTPEEVRTYERFQGEPSEEPKNVAMSVITGGEQ